MDSNISGLNKIIVINCTVGKEVRVTSNNQNWTKTAASNTVEFVFPSVPVPGKKTYTVRHDGVVVATLWLGFGDVKTVNVSDSYLNTDNSNGGIPIGTGLKKTGTNSVSIDLTGSSPISVSGKTISHAGSGVSSGSYGTDGYVPRITVDARGHVTSASNVSIASTPVQTSNNPISSKAVYNILNGTKLANGFVVKHKSKRISSTEWHNNYVDINIDCGENGYALLGVVGHGITAFDSSGISDSYMAKDYVILGANPYLSDNSVSARVRYIGNESKAPSVEAYFKVLYVKN